MARHDNTIPKTKAAQAPDTRPTPLPQAWLDDIREAAAVIRRGGLVLMPTDTIWGIACDATNEEAVRRVFALKQREDGKALITLVDKAGLVSRFVERMPDVAWDLIELSDRPLTVVYDGARGLAPSLVAEDGSAAIRVTKEPFSRALCGRAARPLVSTSANISGQPAPRRFADIAQEVIDGVDYVCRSRRGEKQPARPSAIIRLGSGGEFKIIR
ncbi:MAG: threonylcarbamoyl-AMP synthase [Bacteroidaceae bacterium]|nr:threonylcarbamoyl-AMP synthase [Bacteroidaceae bacterium]